MYITKKNRMLTIRISEMVRYTGWFKLKKKQKGVLED